MLGDFCRSFLPWDEKSPYFTTIFVQTPNHGRFGRCWFPYTNLAVAGKWVAGPGFVRRCISYWTWGCHSSKQSLCHRENQRVSTYNASLKDYPKDDPLPVDNVGFERGSLTKSCQHFWLRGVKGSENPVWGSGSRTLPFINGVVTWGPYKCPYKLVTGVTALLIFRGYKL